MCQCKSGLFVKCRGAALSVLGCVGLGMSDVVMIFWRSAIAIKDHSDLLRVTAETLQVSQVTVGNLLPTLTLFPLHHVEKPATINHQSGGGLVSEVKRIS